MSNLEKFNLEDPITRFYLMMEGQLSPDPERFYSSSDRSLSAYVSYLVSIITKHMGVELTSVDNEEADELFYSHFTEAQRSLEFFKHFKLRPLGGLHSPKISEVGLFRFISDIIGIASGNGQELGVSDEVANYLEFIGLSSSELSKLVKGKFESLSKEEIISLLISNLGGIPNIELVWESRSVRDQVGDFTGPSIEYTLNQDEAKEVMFVLENIYTDKEFASQVHVSRIYRPKSYPNSVPKGKFKHSKLVTHGTQNASVLGIVSQGFTISKTDGNRVISGRMLGNGVYFGEIKQARRSLGFVSTEFDVSYILICKIYWDESEIYFNWKPDARFNGRNVVIGRSVGLRTKRDELVVLPEQVEVKYILELAPNN